MFTGKSWIDGGLEPRAVTRDRLGIDVPVRRRRKKLYVFDAPIGYICSYQRMGCEKEKIGNHTGKIKTQTGSLYWKDNMFSLRFSQRC
jgi:methionyl-tRNA synthetase